MSETVAVPRKKLQEIHDSILSSIAAAMGTAEKMRGRGQAGMADGADVIAMCMGGVLVEDVLAVTGELLGEPVPPPALLAVKMFREKATAHLN